MPIVQLSENVGYIPGGVNIGVIKLNGSSCAMVDTGLNDTSAKKALKTIAADWGGEVTHILSTHAHADHFGGNMTVVKRTGAEVWAPDLDEAILRNPVLLPSLLFAGADPPPSLKGRFLLADPSPVDATFPDSGFSLGDRFIEIVNLSGHSPGQIGLVVEDVFFCADVVLPAIVLEKYRIPYLYSVEKHRQALTTARTTVHDVAVAGHGEATQDLASLIDLNEDLLDSVERAVVDLLQETITAEHLYRRLATAFGVPIVDAVSFFLLQPTIYGFLSFLEATGRAHCEPRDNGLVWLAD